MASASARSSWCPAPHAAAPVGAWLELRGFPAAPALVWRQEGGTPEAMAAWFAAALPGEGMAAGRPEGFAAACLAVPGIPWRPAWEDLPAHGPQAPAYRYRLTLHRRRRGGVILECWRHHGGALGWQRRCGPLPLERFVQHWRVGMGHGMPPGGLPEAARGLSPGRPGERRRPTPRR